ncbi:conserved hypothetical protein [Ricinus communis]|uniref:Calmodulin binding protein n=1 Tax=Ricinus communis TaxID=3988 RepID=B9S9L0_RICCO|nr:conserved hypothetical protein [Ricinus communis]
MISAKKLLKLPRKWQKMAAIRRKRIALPQTNYASEDTSSCSTSSRAEKEYLNNEVIRELFNMAEDEFGLPSKGPLTLPCEAELMEFAIGLIKQQVTRDVEMALLTSIANSCSSSSFHLQQQVTSHQLPICSY